MSFPISFSNTVLVADTLPALKICYYYGSSKHEKLYSYARLYVFNGELAVSFYCFERQATPSRCITIAMDSPQGLILVTATQDTVILSHVDGSTATLPHTFFASNDEQGWCWGVHFKLPLAIAEKYQLNFTPNCTFKGNIFQYITGENGFASCFPACTPDTMFDQENFEIFSIVPY